MGKYYSTDHSAEYHIYTNITYNTEEPQPPWNGQSWITRGRMGGGLKHILPDPNPRPYLLQWFSDLNIWITRGRMGGGA